MIFNIVFFISIILVLIQGTPLTIVVKWFNVALPEKLKLISEIEKLIAKIPKTSLQAISKSAFIVMINPNGNYIRPGSSPEIKAKDMLRVTADSQEDLVKVDNC